MKTSNGRRFVSDFWGTEPSREGGGLLTSPSHPGGGQGIPRKPIRGKPRSEHRYLRKESPPAECPDDFFHENFAERVKPVAGIYRCCVLSFVGGGKPRGIRSFGAFETKILATRASKGKGQAGGAPFWLGKEQIRDRIVCGGSNGGLKENRALPSSRRKVLSQGGNMR